VYLDLLYREDFARTYPGEEAGTAGIWKPVEITRDEIQVLGKMDNVLEKFLREQQEFLQKELLKTNAQADPEAIRKVLDAFVSEEGTKRPISFERKAERLVLDGKMAAFFQPLSPELTSTICISLEKARLLRFGDSHIELAHDALAAIVDGQRSAQQRSLRDALNRLNSAYREHEATGEYLSRRQLNSLEALMPLLTPRISQDIKGFMAASEEHALALEQAELVAERKKRQTARRFAAAGFALAMLAMAGFYAASLQYRAAAQNAAEARLNFAHTLKVEGKYDAALDQLEDIRFKSVLRNTQLEQVAKTKDMWQKIKNYIQEGDKMAAVDDFPKAIESYRQAAQIENDAHIDNLINQTTKDLETTYSEAIRDGQLLMSTRGGIERAIQKFELAGRMKPGDGTASRLLQESKAKRN
jgi:tetratricopeptide (TPR) repeat protein